MGKSEEIAQEVPVPAEEQAEPASSPKGGAGGSILLSFILGLVASLILGWVVFPQLLYSKKAQPFDFNHVLHMEEVSEGCESCHFFREDGSFNGVPKLAQCIDCHEEVQGETEDEAVFVEKYVQQEREVPWHIYSRQPDCVFFSHAAHVKLAGMDCVTCHGHMGESTSLREYQENRITGYSRDIWGWNIAGIKTHTWDRMKMDDCAECHAKHLTAAAHTDARSPVQRQFTELMGIPFSKTTHNAKGSSVQTQKDACFVCHK